MAQTPQDYRSQFRAWFEDCLKQLTGRRIEWPQLLGHFIGNEFCRIHSEGIPYTGPDIFKLDRDELAETHKLDPHQHLEPQLCYKLYREVNAAAHGALVVGEGPVWIINLFVPNQANQNKCCADILGLRPDGSLVVFEAKRATNQETPLYALLEGLDYLAHLLIPKNLERLSTGFEAWRAHRRQPEGFENVVIVPNQRHSVLVLAPSEYYQKHQQDAKQVPQGWDWLSERRMPGSELPVRLDFAITAFTSAPCPLFQVGQ